MKKIYTFITAIITMLFSCGRKGNTLPPIDLSGVKARAEYYLAHMDRVDGWIDRNKCDAVIVSGLLGATDDEVRLEEAEIEPGVWRRKPLRFGECSPEAGTSRSHFSRDQLLGVLWYSWRHKRVDILERLLVKLRKDNYRMSGEGTLGEMLVTPNFLSVMGEMLYILGSDMDVSGERATRKLSYFFGNGTGFERHIEVWQILLRGEVYGELTKDERQALKNHVEGQPENPLYNAAYARWVAEDPRPYLRKAVDLLEKYYPLNRLPNSKDDWCTDWPLSRETGENKGYLAKCDNEPVREWTGADLVIVLKLVLEQ